MILTWKVFATMCVATGIRYDTERLILLLEDLLNFLLQLPILQSL